MSGILCLLLLFSCNPGKRHDAGRGYSVVVLHSYNDIGQEGSYFRGYMDRCFRRHGVDVTAHHIYLDLVHKERPFVDASDRDRFADTFLSMTTWLSITS